MRDVYIIGTYSTAFRRWPDKSYKDLTAEAVQGALTDAGVDKDEVGEAFFASCVIGFLQDQHMVPGQVALRSMGFEGIPIFNVPLYQIHNTGRIWTSINKISNKNQFPLLKMTSILEI